MYIFGWLVWGLLFVFLWVFVLFCFQIRNDMRLVIVMIKTPCWFIFNLAPIHTFRSFAQKLLFSWFPGAVVNGNVSLTLHFSLLNFIRFLLTQSGWSLYHSGCQLLPLSLSKSIRLSFLHCSGNCSVVSYLFRLYKKHNVTKARFGNNFLLSYLQGLTGILR